MAAIKNNDQCDRCIQHFRMRRALLTLDYISAAKTPIDFEGASLIRCDSEQFLGRKLAEMNRGNALKDLAQLIRFWPNVDIQYKEASLEVVIQGCPHYTSLKKLNVKEAEMNRLADLICLEAEFVRGFNPGFKLENRSCQMRGDSDCRFTITNGSSPTQESVGFHETCPAETSQLNCAGLTYASLSTRYALDLLNLSIKTNTTSWKREALRIRFESAETSGRELKAKADSNDLKGLIEHYWSKFPNVECTLDDSVLNCRARSCALVIGLRELGEERKNGLSEMACICDEAVIKGFNPAINFRQTKNLLENDDCCHWQLSMA